MKKRILMIAILCLAQGSIAMDPIPAYGGHAEGFAEGTAQSYAVGIVPPLYKAAEAGNYNEVLRLLQSGANVNAKGDYGSSALEIAARNGYEEVVKLLLENHALVDAREIGGTTPLMWASTADIVELLLRAGADINAIDNEGRSALRHAVARPNFYVIQSLLENGASLEAAAISNNPVMAASPLMAAAETGNEELVMLLLTTPNRKMIIRALAGIKAIQKSQQLPRDIIWLLKKALVARLVEDQMDRVQKATNYKIGLMLAADFADRARNHDLADLLEPKNPASVARIRQRVEENINRLIFGEPRERLEPAQGLSQEEVDDLFGHFNDEENQ